MEELNQPGTENQNGEEQINQKNLKEIIESISAELDKSKKNWNSIITNLASKLRMDLKTSTNTEAEAISYRAEINSEISEYSFKIYKSLPILKVLERKQWEYYATKYSIKTNGSEKRTLVDSDLRWHQAKIDLLKNYIEFLIETRKTIDNILWSIKNKIQLYNITEMEG